MFRIDKSNIQNGDRLAEEYFYFHEKGEKEYKEKDEKQNT